MRDLNIKINDEQSYYLRRFAALQFPGSVENYGTKDPIHLLQQQSSDRKMEKRFWDAFLDCELEGAYYTHEDFYNITFESLDDLVMQYLGIVDDEDIARYNEECETTGNKPFAKFDPDINDDTEFDFLVRYGVDIDKVTAWVQSDAYDTMAVGFTHEEVDHQKELLDNHIYENTITCAMAPTSYDRENSEVSNLMDFMRTAGEILLRKIDLENYIIVRKTIMDPNDVKENFRKEPDTEFVSAEISARDLKHGCFYTVKVVTAGSIKEINGKEYVMLKPHTRHLLVSKEFAAGSDTAAQKFKFPFENDRVNEELLTVDSGILRPVERLLLYTLYSLDIS